MYLILSAALLFLHDLCHEIAHLFGCAFLHLACDVGVGSYGKADFCTLLYAGFAYQPSVQRQILHAAAKYSTVRTSKMVFKNEIKNSRTGCTACTAILKSIPHF